MNIKNISVIGLGQMGTPITSFLLKAGYEVAGYDLIKKQMANLRPLGLVPKKSPADAARRADMVILSLPVWDAVQEAVEGKNGLLNGARRGQIIVDMSTVPPWETQAMAGRLAKKGIEWMDVPISGSAAQARVGNMVFMAGGKKSVFDQIKPVLDKIGKKTVYVGPSGAGATLKLVVNQILFLNQASAIEGFVHGMKAGLDPEAMLEVIASGAAGSDLISARGADMLKGNFVKKGPVWLSIKDLGLALESGKRLGVTLPVSALYHQLLLQAHFEGWDQEDATAVMKIYEGLAGMRGQGAKAIRARRTR